MYNKNRRYNKCYCVLNKDNKLATKNNKKKIPNEFKNIIVLSLSILWKIDIPTIYMCLFVCLYMI